MSAQTATVTSNWTQQNPASSPSVRYGMGMVYDAATKQIVLFGGKGSNGYLADTWTYDGTTWTQQSPANSPPARYQGAMVYDDATGQVVLFGGTNGNLLGDTWTYDGTTWTQSSASGPSARQGASIAYDASTGQVVLIGGATGNGPDSNTWTFNGTAWTQQGSASFFGKEFATTTYDGAIGQLVLFGGLLGDNDTWTYNGTAWTQQNTATSPAGRGEEALAYDPTLGQAVMFGGYNSQTFFNDTWTYNGTTWTQQQPVSSPVGRAQVGMAYDTATGQVVLFGGANSTGYYGDTWTYQLGAAGLPTAAVGTAAAQTPVYFQITSAGTLPALSNANVLTQGASGLDFTLGTGSTCTGSVTAGQTCVVNVAFTPRAPGQRLGAVNLLDSSGNTLATAQISGNGIGAAAVFPGNLTTKTLGSGFSYAHGIVTDQLGNAYIANDNAIAEIVGANGSNPTVRTVVSGFNFLIGLAMDGAGNLYAADEGNKQIYEIMAVNGQIPAHPTVRTLASGLTNPYGVAVDTAGNVYIGDQTAIKEIMAVGGSIPANNPTIRTLTTNVYYGTSVAVDAAGDVFYADYGNYSVKEILAVDGTIPASNPTVRTLLAEPSSANLYPFGVAVDAAGNVYVAFYGQQGITELVAVGGSIPQSNPTILLLGTGFYLPYGVAVDSAGNVYLSDPNNSAVKEIPIAVPPAVSFNSTAVGVTSSDSPKSVVVENIGNANLTFSSLAGSSPNFNFTNNTCITSASVAPSGFCNLVTSFVPQQTGAPLTATETLTDNSLSAGGTTQPIVFSGTATTATGTTAQTITFPQPGSPVQAGTSTTLTATSSSGLPVLYSVVSGPATIGGANFNVVTYTGAGTVVLEADQYGNGTYAAATAVQQTVTVQDSVGVASGTLTATVTITTAGTLGSNGIYVLTTGQPNLDFTFVSGGTCATGTTYAQGATCTVNYIFTPKAPGLRRGAVQLVAGDGVTVLGTTFVSGTGTSAAAAFPRNISTVTLGSGFSGPGNVALDSAGDVYVADITGGAIKEIVAVAGSIPVSNPTIRTLASLPYQLGIAVDGAGDIYVSSPDGNTLQEIVAVGGTIPANNPTIRPIYGGFSAPGGLAIDGTGNLYVRTLIGLFEIPASSLSTNSPTPVELSFFSSLQGIAVDSAGNLYLVEDNAVKEVLAVNGSIPSNNPTIRTLASSFQEPVGVAVDPAGNVYVSDISTGLIQEIVAVGGSIPANNPTILTLNSSFLSPRIIALDGAGNLYVPDDALHAVKELQLTVPPSVSFNSTAVGATSSDSPKNVVLQNVGNAPLIFPGLATGNNPSVAAGFSLGTGAGTCPQVAMNGAAASVGVGVMCNESISFMPTMAGSVSGSVVLTDNSLGKVDSNGNGNAMQSIAVSGMGTAEMAMVSVTSPAVSQGATATLSATVSGVDVAPSGPVTFAVNGTSGIASTCTTAGTSETCTATYSTAGVAGGAYTIVASFNANNVDTNYTATSGSGTLTVVPGSYTAATEPVGTISATQTATVLLSTAGTVGAVAVLTQGSATGDFRLVSGGTCAVGTAYAANTSCTVQYTFKPSRPGQRLGAIVLESNASSATPLGTALLRATGTGPLATFPGSTVSAATVGSGFSYPLGIAVDGAGDVFVADRAHNVVKEILAGTGGNAAGVVSSTSTVLTVGPSFPDPLFIAVDGAGDVFVSATGNGALQEIVAGTGGAPAGTVSSTSTVALVGSGFSHFPGGVAVDGAGNVFVADSMDNVVKEIVAGTGGNAAGMVSSTSTVVTVATGFEYPLGIAVDGAGDVFVSDGDNDAVKEIVAGTGGSAAGTVSSTSTVMTVGSGFGGPISVAVDAAGDVFVADSYPVVDEIVAGTGGNAAGAVSSSSTVVTVDGNFSSPYGVAMDGSGHLFVTDDGNSSLNQLDLTTPTTLNFSATALGATSGDSPRSVTVQNAGNAALTFPVPSSGTNPSFSASGNFSLSSTCPQVSASSSSVGTLASGVECTEAFSFTPTVPSHLTGSLTLTDNSLNASGTTQTISLTGTGLTSSPVGTTSPTQTGTVTFSAAGTLGSINVLTQGATGLDFQPASGGTCTVGASYTAGQVCTVTYTFKPRAPGQRLGAIVLKDNSSPAVTLATILIGGVGTGPQALFQPGVLTNTFSSTLFSARGLTVDVSGNVYVSNTGAKTVLKFAPGSSSPTTVATVASTIAGTAVDGAGNVFFGSGSGIYEVVGGTGTPVLVNSAITNSDNNLSVDGAGNLYTSDSSTGAIYELLAGNYGNAQTLVGGGQGYRFIGMALDASGHLFAADFAGSTLYEVTGNTLTQLVSGGVLSQPHALAVDAADNLYVANYQGTNVYRFAAGNYTAAPTALAVHGQHSLAIGADGSIYSVYNNSNLFQYSRTTGPQLTYSSTAVGASSAAQSSVLENDGNAALTVGSTATGTKSFTAGTATPSTGSTASSVAVAGTLSIPVTFTPQTAGSPTDTLTVTDNSLNTSGTTQTMSLTGTSTAGTATVSVSNVTADANAMTTLSATISGPGVAPTGAVTFAVNGGSVIASACTAGTSSETCTANYNTAGLVARTYNIAAVFNANAADANYASATNNGTLTVNSALVATAAIASKYVTVNQMVTAFVPVAGSGGTGTLTYSISPALPAGLNYATSTGNVSGTPSAPSPTTTYTVMVSDNTGASTTATFLLTVDSAVSATQAIASKTLTQNQTALSFTPITGAGAADTLVYSISPALPTGLSFSSTTGVVSGSPSVASATTTYTVTVTDANNTTSKASATFSLTVSGAVATTQAVASKTLTQGQAVPSFTPVAGSGGTGALTYSVTPSLPNGLMLSPSTGAVSGTPTAASAMASYMVTVTDANNATSSAAFSLTVNDAVVATQAVASKTLTANQAVVSFIPVVGSGGTGTLTYSVSPNLPANLQFSTSSGTVSGTPTIANAITSYTVTVTDVNGATASATFSLTISGAVTATQSVASKALTQNQIVTVFTPVTGSGGTGTLRYSVSPALPAGLTLSATTGAVSGTPTTASVATSYTVTVTDANNATSSAAFTLTVNAAVTATQAVASKTLTANQSASSFTPVTGSGGTGTLGYSVSPTLPSGLTLSATTGVVSGMPSGASPMASYMVTVTDANGATASASFSLTVSGAVTATQSVASKVLTANQAVLGFTPVTGSGGTGTLAYSVSPALPAALQFSTSSGAVSGTPTAANVATSYAVTVTDANGATASAAFSLTVNAAVAATQAVASRTLTANQSATTFVPVTASGGTGALAYSVTPALPAGLMFSTTTGALSGTPTAASGATSYTVTVTDANNATATATFSLTVSSAVVAAQSAASRTLTQGQMTAGYTPVTGSGGTGTLTYSVSPTLPAGLMFSASAGTVSGTPTAASSATSYTVTVTDANNATATATFSLTVSGSVTATVAVASKTLTANQAVASFTPVTGAGGTGTLTYSVSPTLPAGLMFSSTGVVSGTPTAASAAATYTITVTDSNSATATATFSLAVSGAVTAAQVVGSKTLTEGQAVTPFTPVTGSGGTGTLTYNVSPTLPAAMTFSTTTGTLSGTPSTSTAATTYTVTVTDSNNATASATFSLTINGAVTASVIVPSTTLTADQVTTTFTPVTGSGGTGALAYAVSPTLPSGLSFSSTTGAVSGSPTNISSATSYTVTVTDANGASAQASFTLAVVAEASVITFNVPNHTFGDQPFAVSASSPSAGAFTYSVASGPATISGNVVTLTGAGSVTLTASQAASGKYAATSQNATFTVSAGSARITFAVPNHTYGDAPFVVSASSASMGAFTYSVVSGPATMAGNTVTLTGAGTVVLLASQAADNNYAANSQNATFTVAAGSAAIDFAVPNHTYGDAPFSVSATSSSTGAFTYSVVSGPATIAGSTVTLTGAGSVVLKASQAADNNYGANSQNATFSVEAGNTSITFTVPNHMYGDAPFAVSASSSSTGAFSYSVVSGPATIAYNLVTLTGAGTVVLKASQVADSNYVASSQTATFSVALGTAAITFNVPNHTFGDAPFAVSASSASTGAFTYQVVSGPATISVNTVTITGAGTVVLTAAQAADNNYAANSKNASFGVVSGTAAITFNVPNHVYGDTPFAVSASSSSTGAFTYSVVSGPATISGNVATLTGAGTVVLQASQAADSNYQANSKTASFSISAGAAQIKFIVPNHTYGDAPFAVSASSSSTGAFTYSVVSGPALIAGNTVTLTGAGTVVLQASQAADSNYAAQSQNASFSVAAGTAAITFTVPNHTYGDAPFVVSASSNSTGAFTYTVVSGPATISGNTVTLTGAGTVVLKASQAADSNYVANSQNASFNIAAGTSPITFNIANHTYGDAPFVVSASSVSTGAFTYAVISGNATVTGSTVSINGIGAVTLQASQAAESNYAASTKQASFTIAAAPLTVTAANASRPYGAMNPTLTGTVSGQKYNDMFTASFATTASSTSAPGSYAIVPSVAGTNLPDYTVTAVNGMLAVTQAATSITLTSSTTQLYPTQPVTLTVTVASSTTGTPTGTAVITDNGSSLTTVTLTNGTATYSTTLSPGVSHNLLATYSGDVDYLPSASSSSTVVVSAQGFTFTPTTNTVLTGAPGSMLSYSFSLAPGPGGYPGPVTFSVSGLPSGATSSFSPSSIAASAGTQTVTLSITLPAAIAHNRSPFERREERTTALLALLLPLAFSRKLRRKLRGQVLMSVLVLVGLAGVTALTGCGSGGFLLQRPSTYTVNVTATSGSVSHTDIVTLTVQ